MIIPFFKYHGNGNDFILIDDRTDRFSPLADQALIASMCRRHFGIGADGLICIRTHPEADFEMVYYNADGHPGSMCGNGGRCAIHFAAAQGIAGKEMSFIAYDGLHRGRILENGWISLEMRPTGMPRRLQAIPDAFTIDTGSPHFISFVDDADAVDVVGAGRRIRNGPSYREKGINVNFVEVRDDQTLRVLTYERGVEDETLACGTGVTASAIAYVFSHAPGLNQVGIETKGGPLRVRLERNGDTFEHIWLEGPVSRVFRGEWAMTP